MAHPPRESFIISEIATRESSVNNEGTVGVYLDSVCDFEPCELKRCSLGFYGEKEPPHPHPPHIAGMNHYKKICALNSVEFDLNHGFSCFPTESVLKKFSQCGALNTSTIGNRLGKKIACVGRLDGPRKIVPPFSKLVSGARKSREGGGSNARMKKSSNRRQPLHQTGMEGFQI